MTCVHKCLLTSLATIVAISLVADSRAAPVPTIEGKKIIKIYGLDKPNPAYLRQHVDEIEAIGLDGICVVMPTDEPIENDRDRAHGNYLWFSGSPLTRDHFARKSSGAVPVRPNPRASSA